MGEGARENRLRGGRVKRGQRELLEALHNKIMATSDELQKTEYPCRESTTWILAGIIEAWLVVAKLYQIPEMLQKYNEYRDLLFGGEVEEDEGIS